MVSFCISCRIKWKLDGFNIPSFFAIYIVPFFDFRLHSQYTIKPADLFQKLLPHIFLHNRRIRCIFRTNIIFFLLLKRQISCVFHSQSSHIFHDSINHCSSTMPLENSPYIPLLPDTFHIIYFRILYF